MDGYYAKYFNDGWSLTVEGPEPCPSSLSTTHLSPRRPYTVHIQALYAYESICLLICVFISVSTRVFFRIFLSCPVDADRPANAASCHQPLPVSPPAASLLPYSTSSARLPL